MKPFNVSATYLTADDTVQIVVTYDRPPDLSTDYVAFWGGSPAGQWPPSTGFSITSMRATSQLELYTIDYSPYFRQRIGTLEPTLTARTLQLDLPFSQLGLGTQIFDFETATEEMALTGVSSIDRPVVYASEPSTIAIVSFLLIWGVLCLLKKIIKPAYLKKIEGFKNWKLHWQHISDNLAR